MEKTIFNLVRNAIPLEVSNDFIKERIKTLTPKDIISLAEQELKSIEYLVRIELPNWNYWKEKKQRLLKLIEHEKHTLRNQK